jgi:nucleotide-binding universal stress UspA family protein
MKTLISIRQLPYSEPTISFGGIVAGLEHSPITLMTVIGHEDERSAAEAELRKAQALLEDMIVSTKVRMGRAYDQIVNESREGSYDIVVVGSRDIHGLLDGLFGTVTGKVADHLSTPVLVVKNGHTEINKILISVGGQKMNEGIVRTGARLAKGSGADVTLLYVTDPVPTMYTGLGAMDESLETFLETDTPIANYLRWGSHYLADEGVAAELEIVQGVASDEILREARQGDYDLLVIGARAHMGRLERILVDAVTPHVVEKAPCPVLVVR